MKKAVFLDRDGTVVVDKDYTSDPDMLEFVPGACEALNIMARLGYLLVLISNQGGVGNGFFSVEDLEAMDERLREMVSGCGVNLAGTYYCIDPTNANCTCRKPETGLVDRAKADLRLDLARSWMIGDKTSDVMLARNTGTRSILVLTGKAGTDGRFVVEPDHKATDILDAARIIASAPRRA